MPYSYEKLLAFSEAVMCRAGLSDEESRIFSDSLLNAELRGIGSHGLTRLATYAKRVEQGLVAGHTEPEILQDSGAVLRIEGKNAMGSCVGAKVMNLLIDRAAQYGTAFAAVCGGNHFGYAAYFTEMAARQGMLGLAVANGPAAIPPTGGTTPLLGTNPVAISIPAGGRRPITLDMATSAVARGKVALARKNGTSIPLGWGVDSHGKPTTDPNAVLDGGSMLPMAGPKGYGIALIVEILCSCLSGAMNGQTLGSFYDFSRTQDTGFAFGVIDLGKITDPEVFGARMDALCDSVKASSRAEGVDEIFLPGEIESRRADRTKETGITLSAAVEKELREVAAHYAVEFPEEN